MPLDKSIKKVLVIGSGPIVIGQAAEFDYAGAQACRVLKDAGVEVVLCNSNPATIMTDQAMADEIYLEPLTVETIKRIIKKERPDSILAGLGGQTGLSWDRNASNGTAPAGRMCYEQRAFFAAEGPRTEGKPHPAGGFAGRGGHAAHPAVGAVHPFREDRRSKRRPGG